MNMREISVISTLDGTSQPSLFFHPGGEDPVPLAVGLHTWSYDRFNQEKNYLPLAEKFGFALLLPEFRGANLTSNPRCADACGSGVARQDVIDAVRHVCENHAIDRSNVFLLGCSGGGHMALLAAETAPELFRAVDAWCPVSDLVLWHRSTAEAGQKYCRHIEACTGGTPETQPEEYARRSPSTQLERLAGLPVSIHHGRHDPVVPFRHSVEVARKLEALGNDGFYFEIFDGGHDQFPARSFEWFARFVGSGTTRAGITG